MLGMARTTTEPAGRTASSRSADMPATIERNPGSARGAERSADARPTSGLTRRHGTPFGERHDRSEGRLDLEALMLCDKCLTSHAVGFDNPDRVGTPARRHQAGHQGGTRLSAPDHQQIDRHGPAG